MAGFLLASPAKPVSASPDIDATTVEQFEGSLGAAMSTGHPLAKAAIKELAAGWPKSLRFNELLAKIRPRLEPERRGADATGTDDAQELGEILLATYAAGLIELHSYEPHFVVEVSERPVASPLARLQVETGSTVATLRHTHLHVAGPLERALLMLLDGTRNRAALLNDLAVRVESGQVPLEREGAPARGRHEIPRVLEEGLEPNLARLGRLALLVA
jgi:methyltransferase-like protein